ncbi:phosphoenolpyruvate--protein phosphotransferase [bacterium]|nr:phosphoenolpyruvate--protein phosphotransferase [bacterium]
MQSDRRPARGQPHESETIHGIPASPGVIVGPALLFGDILDEVEARSIEPEQVDAEIKRFRDAAALVKEELARDAEHMSGELGQSEADIFLVHAMILEDRKLVEAIEERIRTDLVNADTVVAGEMKRVSSVLLRSDDSYFRDRAYDIIDIGKRVIERMLGVWAHCPLTHPMIIVTRELRASDTVSMDRGRVLGFVTEMGGRQAHAAILARSLGVPAVVGAHGVVDRVRSGDMVVVDGTTGEVLINPSARVIRGFERKQEQEALDWAGLSPLRDAPTRSADGTAIKLMANISSAEESAEAADLSIDGIGLFRTEMPFMAAGLFLSEEEQYRIYRSAAEAMGDHPLTIRTLDIGGDKFVGRENPFEEHNPHLGYRSIRISLDRPEMFLEQLRAILRAGEHGDVRVLWPMISGVEELRTAQELLEQAKASLRAGGTPFRDDMPVGVMIEIPSAVMVADRLAAESDFLSIGTNDLVQYALAVDRSNTYVDHLYRPHDPAVLALIRRTVDCARDAGKPISVCGEMAGATEYIPLLIGLGVRELSVAMSRVLFIRRTIAQTDIGEAEALAAEALAASTATEVAALIGLDSDGSHRTRRHVLP